MPETAASAPKAEPFRSSIMQIEPQWIDYNGHLNMAYYNVMFDRAIDQLWLELGIGPAYMKERGCSTFTAECHVRYLREIRFRDPVQIFVWLLEADDKRLHTFEEMRHASEGWLSATSENMSLHMDMKGHEGAARCAVSVRYPGANRGGHKDPQCRAAARGHRPQRGDALEEISLDPAAAGEADHGRDQEQNDGDEEDDFGDLDRSAGDAAKAEDAGDQRDNQKRHNPA